MHQTATDVRPGGAARPRGEHDVAGVQPGKDVLEELVEGELLLIVPGGAATAAGMVGGVEILAGDSDACARAATPVPGLQAAIVVTTRLRGVAALAVTHISYLYSLLGWHLLIIKILANANAYLYTVLTNFDCVSFAEKVRHCDGRVQYLTTTKTFLQKTDPYVR